MKSQISAKNKKNEKDDHGLLLIIVAILLAMSAIFYDGQSDKISLSSTQVISNGLDLKLKETLTKSELQTGVVDLDSRYAEPIEELGQNNSDESVLPLLLDQENPAKKVLGATEKRNKLPRPLTPDQRISAKLEKEQWADEEHKRREEEYVRQFLDNAKKSGVNVRLNKNLDVIGLDISPAEEPIRVPQSISTGSK